MRLVGKSEREKERECIGLVDERELLNSMERGVLTIS